jgi:hypothetical protein
MAGHMNNASAAEQITEAEEVRAGYTHNVHRFF